MKHKYTKADVENYAKESVNIRQLLEKLGVIPAGGNYDVINRFIEKNKIDTSHFTGQRFNLGRKFPDRKRPIEDYLVENCIHHIGSNGLRKRLIEEGIFDKKCYCCDNTRWLDKEIPLELEHINGNHNDDRKENLTLLCPNCHAQTKTYRGKNKKYGRMAER